MLISRNNLFKHLTPAKETFNSIALFVEFRIELEWPSSFRMSPRSLVNRDIDLDLSFPIVLKNFLGIVGRICGDG